MTGRSREATGSRVLVPLEVLVARIASLLVAPFDPALTVAVVAISLGGSAPRHAVPDVERIRDDDLVATVGPRVAVACAIVRRDRGPEAFRLRLAAAFFGQLGEEMLRSRSAVATAAPGSGIGHEALLRRALEGLEAGRPRPRRRRVRRQGSGPPLAGPAPGEGRAVAATSPGDASAAPEPPASGQLSRLAIRGGGYLVVREAFGMVLRLAGVVLTVREIGPAGYGIYSGAAAFVALVTVVSQMGVETYLMRQPGELDRRHYDVAFTFLLGASLSCTAVALGLTFVAAPVFRPVGVLVPLRVLLVSVPLNVLWAPAQAAIERQFRYRAMGLLEVGGDLVLYGTAVPLALTGAGPWSLVAGFIALQAWLLVGGYVVSGLRPRLAWSGAIARELTRHGFSYSLSTWAVRLRGLVSPLVVGSVAGAAGVGYVAFAQRLVDTVGFARRGAYRLGMVAMGQVPSDQRSRLRYAIEEGTVLQLVALVAPFALFGLVVRRLVPVLFGVQWERAVPLYVLLSVAAVLGSVELIQSTFLFSRGRNLAVATASAVSTAVLATVAFVAVRRWGIDGYGVAALASLVELFVVDRAVRALVQVSYRAILPTALVAVPLLLLPVVAAPASALLALPFLGALALPGFRGELVRLVNVVRASLGRPGRALSGIAGAPAAELPAA